jgi:hypothetical protein
VGLSRLVIRKLLPELQSLGSPAWAFEMVSVFSVSFTVPLYNTMDTPGQMDRTMQILVGHFIRNRGPRRCEFHSR